MPHSMPYGEQSNKWFTILIIAGLPFYIVYKWLKNDLSYINQK